MLVPAHLITSRGVRHGAGAIAIQASAGYPARPTAAHCAAYAATDCLESCHCKVTFPFFTTLCTVSSCLPGVPYYTLSVLLPVSRKLYQWSVAGLGNHGHALPPVRASSILHLRNYLQKCNGYFQLSCLFRSNQICANLCARRLLRQHCCHTFILLSQSPTELRSGWCQSSGCSATLVHRPHFAARNALAGPQRT